MNFNPIFDHYRTLGVRRDSHPAKVRMMYHKLTKVFHPDSHGPDPELEEWLNDRMAELNAAYEVLGDPLKRKEYDRELEKLKDLPPEAIHYFEKVPVNNWEEARAILLDGVGRFDLQAPTEALDREAKKEMEKLARKKTHKYLRMGVPYEYEVSYLLYALESLAADAIERVCERDVFRTVQGVYNIIILMVGIVAAYRSSDGLLMGLWDTVVFALAWAIYFQAWFWAALFTAHGLRSGLTGKRAYYLHGAVALLLAAFSVATVFL